MKSLSGKIVGTKQKNTLIVEVERFFRHRIYEKRIKRTKRFHVHYGGEDKKLGEIVRFIPTRPISKLKRWKVVDTISSLEQIKEPKKVITIKEKRGAKRK